MSKIKEFLSTSPNWQLRLTTAVVILILAVSFITLGSWLQTQILNFVAKWLIFIGAYLTIVGPDIRANALAGAFRLPTREELAAGTFLEKKRTNTQKRRDQRQSAKKRSRK